MKQKLKASIEKSFSSVGYPDSYDFQMAVNDYDYEDRGKSKPVYWHNIKYENLISYGEIIHFFSEDGAKYYLQAYLINLIDYPDLFDVVCFISLMNYLRDVDVSIFDGSQRQSIIEFLTYYKTYIIDELNHDEDDEKEAENLIIKFSINDA
ncbi:MAG: DUF6714 family protein [Arenicella sp.]